MVVSDLRRHQACMRRRREQCCAEAAHFEQPEDLRGPGVGLKLAACKSHGAIGIEGQDGLIREAPGIFQGFLVEGLLVALHHDLKGDAPHLSILLEAIVLPAKQSSVKRPGSPWAPRQTYNMSARLIVRSLQLSRHYLYRLLYFACQQAVAAQRMRGPERIRLRRNAVHGVHE